MLKPITHTHNGVIIGGKLYRRDEYYVATHVSTREWLALGVLVFGLVAWAVLVFGGIAWVIWVVLRGPR